MQIKAAKSYRYGEGSIGTKAAFTVDELQDCWQDVLVMPHDSRAADMDPEGEKEGNGTRVGESPSLSYIT